MDKASGGVGVTHGTLSVSWPPYSGDDATCEKCGYDSVDTKFVNVACIEVGNGRHMTDRFPMGGVAHGTWEHLHRECRRCGWSWDEALADQATVSGS